MPSAVQHIKTVYKGHLNYLVKEHHDTANLNGVAYGIKDNFNILKKMYLL
jgi:hypothetical protein